MAKSDTMAKTLVLRVKDALDSDRGNFPREFREMFDVEFDKIALYGVSIIPTIKGKDSVNQGIQYVQGQRISVTKRSKNIIDEYKKYLWKLDKDGRITNIPDGGYDHTLDAIRYAMQSIVGNEEDSNEELSMYDWKYN